MIDGLAGIGNAKSSREDPMTLSPCLCGSRDTWNAIRFPRFGKRRLYRCGHCGSVVLFPFPEADGSAEIYQSADYLADITPDEYYGYYKVFEEHLRTVVGVSTDSAILDFGAGRCYYQKFLLSDGYRTAHSLEINRSMLAYARSRLGLTNVYASMDDLPIREYDAIISSQVMEHLPDPVKTLHESIASRLRPGGVVVFGVPNWDSLNRLLLGPRWVGYCPEDHIWFFNRDSIRRLFAASPLFDVIDIRVRAAVGKEYDAFRPNTLPKVIYYRTFWRSFERIGRGDQLLVTLRRTSVGAPVAGESASIAQA